MLSLLGSFELCIELTNPKGYSQFGSQSRTLQHEQDAFILGFIISPVPSVPVIGPHHSSEGAAQRQNNKAQVCGCVFVCVCSEILLQTKAHFRWIYYIYHSSTCSTIQQSKNGFHILPVYEARHFKTPYIYSCAK